MTSRRSTLSRNQKLTLLIASLAILATIIAAFISSHDWLPNTPSLTDNPETEYIGRVIDINSQQPISGVKVTLDLLGVPPIIYTDSEGVYRFKVVITSEVSGQIRVDAQGYQVYTRNITISTDIKTIEDVRLIPVQQSQIAPTALTITQPATSTANLPLPTSTIRPDYFESRGLNANCFDAQYWTPKNAVALSTNANNCWILSGWGVLPEAGGFQVFINPANSVVSHWISTPIPRNARISFTINISDFNTVNGVFGNLVFGFGKSSEDFLTGKFLIYRVIQAGSRMYIHFGDPISHENTPITLIREYPKGTNEKVLFVINEISLEVYINGEVVVNQSLSTDERELFWIGFRLPQTGVLNASISNFEIK